MLEINALVNSFREFQAILSEYLKRLSLNSEVSLKVGFYPSKFEQIRISFNNKINYKLNPPIAPSNSLFGNVSIKEIVYALKNNGFAFGINLPKEIIQEILEFVKLEPCYGNGNPNLGFYPINREQAQAEHGTPFVFGSYFNTALLCSAIKQLESDPILLEIARQYLQAEPVHQGNQLWWNFPVKSTLYERRQATQMFYSGLDKHRLLKFSFYITDVDLCSSPHVSIRGSHIKKKFSHWFLGRGCSYQEVTKYYGYKNIVPICGKAGFGFVEDPRCFHKETPLGSKERLTLQIEFAAKDYGRPNDVRDLSQFNYLL